MASNQQSTSNDALRRFDKELSEDVNDYHLPENTWTQARNAINNSKTGDLGKLGNEPGNQYCTEATYAIVGAIHTEADIWVLFSTDETNSEIGLFKETGCVYKPIVNNICLNFSKFHLVKGVSRPTADCNWKVYWDDGNNPSRVMTIKTDDFDANLYTNPNSPIPWIQNCTDENGNTPNSPLYPQGCIFCQNTPNIDCDKIRLAPYIQTPCITVKKGTTNGTLLNGSYFVVIAYTLNGQKVTDYFKPSNVQPIFDHRNESGSLDITIDNADTNFDGYVLVVVSNVNNQTVAKKVGTYNITQDKVTLDVIALTLETVPIEQIPLRTPVYEKTEGMYTVSDYLIRKAPTTKLDFNYQPLANQIVTMWQSVEYPADYYQKGGSNTGYLRDEVYSFFIRWIYDTGDKSSSYHIPGRPALTVGGYNENAFTLVVTDALPEEITDSFNYNWWVNNLADIDTANPYPNTALPDGGVVVAQGIMGYWESTEYYPNNNPEVWNANDLMHPWTAPSTIPYNGTVLGSTNITTGTVVLGDYDLCGKHIRHHKFPDVHVKNDNINAAYHFNAGGDKIRIMGVAFDNIKAPVDNEGNPIPGIVGYEILRGSRQGNKTIIAKGLINNMWKYDLNLDLDSNPNTGTIQGLYQNYPYNDLRPDKFLSTKHTWYKPVQGEIYQNPTDFSRKDFTFHSPDTTFNTPFLATTELKVSSEYNGIVDGKFEWSELHPKAKVLRNMAFILSAITGVGIAAIGMNGQRTVRRQKAQLDTAIWGMIAGTDASAATVPAAITALTANNALYAGSQTLLQSLAFLLTSTAGGTNTNNAAFQSTGYDGSAAALASLTNILGGTKSYDYVESQYSSAPFLLRLAQGAQSFFYYWTQGTDATLDLIRALAKYQNFALKYNSHGFYDNFRSVAAGNHRRSITDENYIGPEFVNYSLTKRINNLYRNKTVAVSVDTDINDPFLVDNTRERVSDVPTLQPNFDTDDPTGSSFNTVTSAYYSSLKQRLRNQYGQIDSISEVLVDKCYTGVKYGKPVPKSGTLFGGDIYINRYTEKTTFFYFYDWLYTQSNGYEFNYDLYRMIPYPRYWLNMTKFDTTDFTSSILSTIASPSTWSSMSGPGIITPSDYYNLDNFQSSVIKLTVKNAYFYLFNSGIRDFFVESELNVGLRDWGELETQKYYPLLDPKTLFDTKIIKEPNYYKYDNALSIVNTIVDRTSWGNTQPRTYSPYLSETCYTYTPTRVVYSLASQYESKTDYWRVFLVNNYYDFDYYVTSIKPINKSGAMIFFDSASPVQFQGLDQLQTDLGTKLTIGDGGLFSQPLQNIVNADASYEYGSCQDDMSIINTPMGVYWMSQNQGKILKIGNGIEEISLDNMKWWFAQYLPYELLTYFPDFELTNNPVAGIGCQSIFDNQNQLLYFCKRDYALKSTIPSNIALDYVGTDQFTVNVIIDGIKRAIGTTTLGDPLYFDDASWTISYDPKTQGFISYHDWHPTYSLPGKNTFMTVNPTDKKSIWIHNERCDLYANYYGIDYPFEVEWAVNTGNIVNTLRSVEYQLEVYKYAPNCYDRFHKLDTNFDEAVVYNTEQCSGLLKLNLTPRNNAPAILNYPIINPTNIEILFSKVEQKYRFNQFWDITRDRGEFPIGSPYPPPTPNVGSYAQQTIWNTQANGYVRVLNPNNLNYNKFALERKKFRHYTTSILLRKLVSGDSKFLVMLSTNKNLYSSR